PHDARPPADGAGAVPGDGAPAGTARRAAGRALRRWRRRDDRRDPKRPRARRHGPHHRAHDAGAAPPRRSPDRAGPGAVAGRGRAGAGHPEPGRDRGLPGQALARPHGSAAVLTVDGLSVAYEGLRAVDRVSLAVAEGEFVTIVGPNGAGKTTLLKAISG